MPKFMRLCRFFRIDREDVRRTIGRVWRTRFGLRPDPAITKPWVKRPKTDFFAIGVRPEDEASVEAMFQRLRAREQRMKEMEEAGPPEG